MILVWKNISLEFFSEYDFFDKEMIRDVVYCSIAMVKKTWTLTQDFQLLLIFVIPAKAGIQGLLMGYGFPLSQG